MHLDIDRENIYIIKTLREFVYVSDEGRDEGANGTCHNARALPHSPLTPRVTVRQKAKEITALLMDDARIREQRKARSNMRDRMSGNPGRRRDDSDSEDEDRMRRRGDRDASRNARKQQETGEDDEMSRAIAESKRSAAKDAERARRSKQQNDDLEEAMRLSREEEERRKRMLAGNNGSLFDPDNPDANGGGRSAWDNLIDMSDSQPQQQPQYQQPMITGFPTTQFQSFNPYAAQQEEMMRQQQMAEMQRQVGPCARGLRLSLSILPLTCDTLIHLQMQLQAEQEAYNQMLQQQAYQQQQLVYQQQLQQQQQQMQHPAPLVPQHTSIGSNNPFAQFSKPASPPPMPVTQAPALAQRPATTQPAASARPPKDDGKHAHLANLLGNRDDGIDSFGNTNLAKLVDVLWRVLQAVQLMKLCSLHSGTVTTRPIVFRCSKQVAIPSIEDVSRTTSSLSLSCESPFVGILPCPPVCPAPLSLPRPSSAARPAWNDCTMQ